MLVSDSPKGKSYWKLNCHYLRHDADFVAFLKDKISEFKEVHRDTDCDPHVVWDAFKCTITGHCIQYCSRKKKEKQRDKQEILEKIDQIKHDISNISPDDTQQLSNLLHKLDSLEADLNKIIDQETAGLIVRSRIKWAEQGEKSSKYFCNLEKRSNEKKSIHILKDNSDSIISDQEGHSQRALFLLSNSVYLKIYSS